MNKAVTGTEKASRESLYRTKWLIAHNWLHAVVHGEAQLAEAWSGYLKELESSDAVAARPG